MRSSSSAETGRERGEVGGAVEWGAVAGTWIIGISAVGPAALILWRSSKPLMPGSTTSGTATSGSSPAAESASRSRASVPSTASVVWWPTRRVGHSHIRLRPCAILVVPLRRVARNRDPGATTIDAARTCSQTETPTTLTEPDLTAPLSKALFGTAGSFFLVGAALSLAADLAYRAQRPAGNPGPESAWILAYTCVAIGVGIGLALLAARNRLPVSFAAVLPFLAIVLLAVPMLEGRRLTSTGAILLLWPAMYAGSLLTERVAWATTATSLVALLAACVADPNRTLINYGPTAATLMLTFYATASLQRRRRRLISQLALQAGTDTLTGLANRRTFLQTLGREVAEHRRRGSSLCLLMIDADRFKRVNDTAGHDVGDEVLRRLSVLLRRDARRGDLAARFGGEEFMVLMADCSLANAAARADELRATIAAESTGWPHPLTVSIGVAELPPDMPESEATSMLLGHADEALYAAKQAGRDRAHKYES